MTRYLSLVFILFVICSCEQTESPLTTEEQKEIIESVKETLYNYFSDIKTSGLTAEFGYLDHSSDFFWVPPGYASAISYDSVVSVVKKNASSITSVNNSFDTLRIVPLNRQLATYTARIKSDITDTTGRASSFSLIETGVLIKRRDGWKLLCGETSVIGKE
jgi:hypothetical protein